ncbi:endonuclease I family protein [Brevibacillus dissolubilis]|uniref:endonuclease I family protein n=1 Tax=Brevibacillus dissolubilis TaxID=1844116 RepID=UPI00210063FC|nr:endonuclease [Brevibacillus dissolubilis]
MVPTLLFPTNSQAENTVAANEATSASVTADSTTDPYYSYYQTAYGKTGTALKSALHNIIDDHKKLSYDSLWAALRDTDEDPNNPNNVILLYTGRSQSKLTNGGLVNDWNREHVWAKSHGGFGETAGAGTDLHHIRPADVSVNSARGNLDFDNGGVYHSEATLCRYDSDSWEPRDAVKGDVARMLLYMAVRYEGDVSGEPNLEMKDAVNTGTAPYHGKLSTLLQWHLQDPVDSFEMRRNNIIYTKYQGNRNPFIDHPEWVDLIW